MLVTRTSIFTGIKRTRDLPVTEVQMKTWEEGTPVQVAFPQLSSEDREFILSGATNEEWDKYVPDEE